MTISYEFHYAVGENDFRKQLATGDQLKDCIDKLSAENGMSVLVDMKTTLPEVYEPEYEGFYPNFVDPFWGKFSKDHPKIGVMLSLSMLHHSGAAITSGLSLEQTVEDLAAEIYLFPRLKALSQFRHLFVRVENKALIYINNVSSDPLRSIRFEGVLHF